MLAIKQFECQFCEYINLHKSESKSHTKRFHRDGSYRREEYGYRTLFICCVCEYEAKGMSKSTKPETNLLL